jgi:hypothetical protein
MKNLKKKILKRAKAVRRPAKKAASHGMSKLRIGSIVGLAALMVARKRRRAKRPARQVRRPAGG